VNRTTPELTVKYLEALARTKMLKGPPENKAVVAKIERNAPPADVQFASEGAVQIAAAAGLTRAHFEGRLPSSTRGFTVKDVRELLNEKLPAAPPYLQDVGEEEEESGSGGSSTETELE
jgi:hypothetical protein